MSVSKIGSVSCPQCSKKVVWNEKSEHRPFCSERCKLIDLGEWAEERHAIPGTSLPSTDGHNEFEN